MSTDLNLKAIFVSSEEEISAVVRWVNRNSVYRTDVINPEDEVALKSLIDSHGYWITFKAPDEDIENTYSYEILSGDSPEYPYVKLEPEFSLEVTDMKVCKDIVEVFGVKYHTDVLYNMLRLVPTAEGDE